MTAANHIHTLLTSSLRCFIHIRSHQTIIAVPPDQIIEKPVISMESASSSFVKTEFLSPDPLKLYGFHHFNVDQKFHTPLSCSLLLQLGLPCFFIKIVYKHNYICNNSLASVILFRESLTYGEKLHLASWVCVIEHALS